MEELINRVINLAIGAALTTNEEFQQTYQKFESAIEKLIQKGAEARNGNEQPNDFARGEEILQTLAKEAEKNGRSTPVIQDALRYIESQKSQPALRA